MTKYNKVKKALFDLKARANKEINEANTAGSELTKLTSTYEALVVEHQKLQKSSTDREKVLKKREDKTK